MNKKAPIRRTVLTIMLFLLALLFLTPMVLTLAGSLMSEDEIEENYGVLFDDGGYMTDPVTLKLLPDEPTTQQYTKLTKTSDFIAKYRNSVLYTIPITILQTAVSALAAYGFTRYRSRVRRIIFLGYTVLILMPYQVTLVPNYFVSKWLGIYNTPLAIILPGVFSAFGVYLLTKYMARVPKETMEAARIDGAGEWQVFWCICLPQCKSALWTVAMLTFFDNWSMVESPLVLLRGDSAHPLSVYLSELNAGEPGLAFAAAVVYMIPCFALFLIGQRHLGDGVGKSGTKNPYLSKSSCL